MDMEDFAFPVLDDPGSGLRLRHAGMTLRDWFASTLNLNHNVGLTDSMCNVLAGEPQPPETEQEKLLAWCLKVEARYRYLRADAMLDARKQ